MKFANRKLQNALMTSMAQGQVNCNGVNRPLSKLSGGGVKCIDCTSGQYVAACVEIRCTSQVR